MNYLRHGFVFLFSTLFLGMPGLQAAPLHEAARAGDKARIAALLAEGADINAKDNSDYSPLHSAVDSARPEAVELLLAHGAAVEARGVHSQEMTPLHLAAFRGLKNIASLLLAAGADINARSLGGQTALFYAVSNDRKDVVKLLVAEGADIYAQDKDGATIVHESAGINGGFGLFHIGELLLSPGANADGRDKSGRTALHLATFYGNAKVAELLLAKGADVDALDSHGSTPLFKATTNDGVADVFRLLLDHGAQANVQNKDGLTPLHNAAASGTKEIVELLLDHDAALEIENNDGQTPLDLAALSGSHVIFALLRARIAALPLSPDAETAIQQGIAAAKQPDYPEAIRHFEISRAAAPYSPLPLYYLGLAESKITGRELRAICWFKAFLTASPASPKADAVTAEIASLEERSREILLQLITSATVAADLLPTPPANEPQDPSGSSLDYALKSVALLWARTGDGDRAIKRASRVTHPFLRTLTAIEIARPLALAGDLEQGKRAVAIAVSSAERLERSDDRAIALRRAATAMADLGDGPGARSVAARIDDTDLRCQAEFAIAQSQAIAGNFGAAMTTAEAIPVRFYRSAAQASIARTAAESGDRTTAARMLDSSRASLAGVAYDQKSVYDFAVRAAVVTAGRGYNLQALERGVFFKEYDPRPAPVPPKTVDDVDRQSFDVRRLHIDRYIAEGLIREPNTDATRSYLKAGQTEAVRDLGIALARLGNLREAGTIFELSRSYEFSGAFTGRWRAEMQVGIARGFALAGDLENARKQLVAARSLAKPEELRLIDEASNGWIAANDYLLNDALFTRLPEHLKRLPAVNPDQTFSALADTALTLAEAQRIIFALRSRPFNERLNTPDTDPPAISQAAITTKP